MATALTLHPVPLPVEATAATHSSPSTVSSIRPPASGTRVPDSLFEQAGLVGANLQALLRVAIPGKLLLRGGHDPIALVGRPGSGRHSVADALHLAARDLLDRSGERVDVSMVDNPGVTTVLDGATRRAKGGTLVIEGLETLPAPGRRVAARLVETAARRDDVLVIAVVDAPDEPPSDGSAKTARPARLMWWPGTRLELPGLSRRGSDTNELVAHMLTTTRAEVGGPMGSPAAEVVEALTAEARARRIDAVGELKHLVRDVVFDAFARHGRPVHLSLEDVGEVAAERSPRATDFEPPAELDRDMLRLLADTHGVPERVLAQQVTVLRDVIGRLDDVPRSYANILERAEDIKRASLWLWAGADSQASFRKAFGDERHMQPSKSVSWAFYNRVFKRDI